MIVCIDTNVVLGMFTAGHAHRPIFDAWFDGQFQWAVTTEIYLEYTEIMLRQAGQRKTDMMMQIFALVNARHGNLLFGSPTFRFHLITADPDDDKFADCAIAAEADWIITSDRHFEALIGSGYKPQPITPLRFIERCLNRPPT